METHHLGLLICVLFSFCRTVHGIQQYVRFEHEASLDNKQCTAMLQSFSTKAQSTIQCSLMCAANADCISFFYSKSTDDCTGCVLMPQTCETCTEEASETRYYKDKATLRGVSMSFSTSIDVKDCLEIKQNFPSSPSGNYTVKLPSNRYIDVYCDMDTDGGGWTVFQNRYDGTVDFYRTFQEYTDGFGNLTGEFWLGLQNIYEMAPPELQSEVYLYLEDGFSESKVDRVSVFSVGNGTCYNVTLQNGDSDLTDNNGRCFSAKDYGPTTYCARQDQSGWWHEFLCTNINPNGVYATPGTTELEHSGLIHYEWKGYASLATSKIMFRRK